MLGNLKVRDVIDESQEDVFVASSSDNVRDVLRNLLKNRLHSLPVLGEDECVSGVVDTMGILNFLIKVCSKNLSTAHTPTSESLHTDDVEMVLMRSKEFNTAKIEEVVCLSPINARLEDGSLEPVDIDDDLSNALEAFKSGVHSLLVEQKEDGEKVFAFAVSQSDIINYVVEHPEVLGERADTSIESLGLIRTGELLVTAPSSRPAISVFHHSLFDNKVRSVPLVNENGELEGVISATDVVLMGDHLFDKLLAPAGEFIGQIRGEKAPIAVRGSSSLMEICERFSAENVQQICIVDGDRRPVGIVSITDILKVIWE